MLFLYRKSQSKIVLGQNCFNLSLVVRKQVIGVSDQVPHKRAIQPHKMARGLKFCIYKVEGLYYLCRENKGADQLHTCDTFLNQNREIWNFWSGNSCLVSGGFHVANFGPFLPKLKSRNLVTFLEICYRASQCQQMPTEVRICVRLQFKKPPLLLF